MSNEQERPLSKQEQLDAARALEKTRKAATERKRKQREREKAGKKVARAEQTIDGFNSEEDCSKTEAKDILRESRNLTQGYIVNAAYEMGKMAAKRLKIVPNAFFWANGVLNTLESLRTGEPHLLTLPEDRKADGEVFRNQDRQALWDFGASWREQKDGHRITFEEYCELRALKANTVELGNRLLDRDFHPEPHGEWMAFLPQRNINALPENYSQEDMKRVLGELSPIHSYLLMAARNSYKTAYITCDLLGWLCCYYDLRVMIASATTALSKDTIKAFRKYFLVENDDLTPFQQIFSEMVLWNDDSSVLSYECPAARLNLAQPSAFCVGLDTTVSGRRCDLCVTDDLSDNTNSDTPELRASTQRKFELMIELLEPTGYLFMLGTPYAEGDLLWTALDRNDRNTEKSLHFRIDPSWQIIDEARRREVAEKPELLYEVTEPEVRLLFPSRLTFAFLKRKLQNSELKTFRQQQLLEFVGDAEGQIRLNFELERLQANVIQPNEIPVSDYETPIVLSLDRAYSTKRYADRSSVSVVKFYKNTAGIPSMCVLFNKADRWTTSELGVEIVETAIQYKVNLIVAEQDPAWRDLATVIQLEADKRRVVINVFWKPVTTTRNSKIIKFKSLEGMLGSDPSRLTFVSGPWIEDTFGEFLWQDGIRKSSGSAKDDRVDSLALATLMLPGLVKTDEAEATQKARDDAEEQGRMREQYEMLYGSGSHMSVSTGRAWRYGADVTEKPRDQGRAIGVTRGHFGIPGLRSNADPQSDSNKKPISFADINPKKE